MEWLNYLEKYNKVDVTATRQIVESMKSNMATVLTAVFNTHPFVSKQEAKLIVEHESLVSTGVAPEWLVENKTAILTKIESLTEGEIRIIINNDVSKGSNQSQPSVMVTSAPQPTDVEFEGEKKRGRGRPKKVIAPVNEEDDEEEDTVAEGGCDADKEKEKVEEEAPVDAEPLTFEDVDGDKSKWRSYDGTSGADEFKTVKKGDKTYLVFDGENGYDVFDVEGYDAYDGESDSSEFYKNHTCTGVRYDPGKQVTTLKKTEEPVEETVEKIVEEDEPLDLDWKSVTDKLEKKDLNGDGVTDKPTKDLTDKEYKDSDAELKTTTSDPVEEDEDPILSGAKDATRHIDPALVSFADKLNNKTGGADNRTKFKAFMDTYRQHKLTAS